jgi:mono/diheme cytochrome c family protein
MSLFVGAQAASLLRILLLFFFLTALTPLLSACSNSPAPPESIASPAVPSAAAANPVHQIVLPHDEPDFPPGAGRDVFMSRCMVCHSLRYITMQPDFPGKTWGKEVDKMVKTYGAHITPDEARQITAYLAAIKGSDKEKQPQP